MTIDEYNDPPKNLKTNPPARNDPCLILHFTKAATTTNLTSTMFSTRHVDFCNFQAANRFAQKMNKRRICAVSRKAVHASQFKGMGLIDELCMWLSSVSVSKNTCNPLKMLQIGHEKTTQKL
jgi:hypothetical protein